jgi:hypothetical protein
VFETKESFLADLAEKGHLNTSKSEILRAIAEFGNWQEFKEWRISTVTEFNISIEKFKNEDWFKVTVKCDYEFSCVCPTIERAMEMAGMYQQLIMHLFNQVGWPSWASISSVNP